MHHILQKLENELKWTRTIGYCSLSKFSTLENLQSVHSRINSRGSMNAIYLARAYCIDSYLKGLLTSFDPFRAHEDRMLMICHSRRDVSADNR